MTARRHRLVVPLLAVLAAAAGCGSSGPVTYLWVDVDARPGVRGTTKLEVTVRQGGESLTKTFGDGVAPFALPTDFTVTPNAHLGTLSVEAVAYGVDELRLGAGTVSAAVARGSQPRVTLLLAPVDFQVNTTIPNMQIVTDYGGSSGRQLAASADGNLVAVYENISPLGRYDGLGRLFDGDGGPRQNEVSRTRDDFVLNQGGSESVFFVAVATTGPGAFLATWCDFSDLGVVNARAFDPAGAPAAEVAVSAAGALDLGAGHAAAFGDGSFVVVWSQARSSTDGTLEVRARLLDSTGQPRRNSTTGNDVDFAVSAVTTNDADRPTVAVGPDQSFVVAWLELAPAGGGTIEAQRFSTEGQVRGAQLRVGQTAVATPDAPNLAATPDGYLVVYTDEGLAPGDSDVLVRYLSQEGVAPQPAYRVNSSTDGAQVEPAVAVAADGRALVVWTETQARPEDTDNGSIRGRALHPFGLPLGADFAINTTTTKAQYYPSVAAAAHGAFMVTWQDESAVGPDVDQSGIRGRLIYPDFALHDGGAGATCGGPADCEAELQCTTRPGLGAYCHIGCTDAALGQPCPFGGICTAAAAAGTPGAVCLFR